MFFCLLNFEFWPAPQFVLHYFSNVVLCIEKRYSDRFMEWDNYAASIGKLKSVGLWDDFAERVVGRIEHSRSKGHLTEKSLMSNMYRSKRFFYKWSPHF